MRGPGNADVDVALAAALDALGPLVDVLADRFADRVAERLASPIDGSTGDGWLDVAAAADYIGMHKDTLRKAARARRIPFEQDGPGCKLYFRRPDLDRWRRDGGGPAHLREVASTRLPRSRRSA